MQVSSAASVFARGTVALRRDRGAARGASRARALAAQPVVAAKAEAGKVKKVNSEELEKAIAERTKPLVVDFFAHWCGPCVLLAQELEQVAEKMGDSVTFLKVDTEEEEDLATQLQIHALPTLVFVPAKADKQALRTEGLLSAEVIEDIIKTKMQ